mmetsp:Transcript_43452/g.87601  ORF Transcript_43452/g.87601 Transcript_43452/m.87601 type:complete len:420 (-) Transcript_43452:534-1793(-)
MVLRSVTSSVVASQECARHAPEKEGRACGVSQMAGSRSCEARKRTGAEPPSPSAMVPCQQAATGLIEDVRAHRFAFGQAPHEIEGGMEGRQRGPLGEKHVDEVAARRRLVNLYGEHDPQLPVFAHHRPRLDSPRRGVVPLVAEISQRRQHLGHEHCRLHRDLDAHLPRTLRAHGCLADNHTAVASHGGQTSPWSQLVERRIALLLELPVDPGDLLVVAKARGSPGPLVLPEQVCEGALLRRTVRDEVVRNLLIWLEVGRVLDRHAQVLYFLDNVWIVVALLELRIAEDTRQVLRKVPLEPLVLPDLCEGDSSCGVHDQHLHDKVLRFAREVSWQGEVPVLDLAEEVRHVLVIKGERAAQERIQDDATGPDVHLGPHICLPRDNLWRCVVGRAARRLQVFTVSHHVGQPEVRDLDVQVGV